jgi:tRNA dimethylallyltransferase
MHNAPQKIICLLGPTASGKTNLALALAAQLPIEIISVDSALIYRGMDIGTAKPDAMQLNSVPHHLINTHDPTEAYSAADFCRDLAQLVPMITARKKIPLLVGGTMLYFRSIWQELAALPPADPIIRESITARAIQEGWGSLHDELKKVDPVSAARIHRHDPQRIQRALEVYYITGQPLSQFFTQHPISPPPYDILKLALIPHDRERLHQRIAERFDLMLQAGFIQEVEQLRARGDLSLTLPSIRTVGYRQVWEYLDGMWDYATMREKAIIATRQLAKRQLTWLRSFDNVARFDSEDPVLLQKVLDTITAFL